MSGSQDNADGKRKWTAKPFVGMIEDLKRRAPHYLDDWVQGFHPKVLSSTLFMYGRLVACSAAAGRSTGLALELLELLATADAAARRSPSGFEVVRHPLAAQRRTRAPPCPRAPSVSH